jgi:hypothetical protein
MNPVYFRIQERAREIVAEFPKPDFYVHHSAAHQYATSLFETDPLIADLRHLVFKQLDDSFGHGLQHAFKVAVDGGTLLYIEGSGLAYPHEFLARRVCIVQCAGLLHDIKRKQSDHSTYGAAHAREVLKNFALSAQEVEDISVAIHNHEAFKVKVEIGSAEGELVSDCLYDADKFRWGPDNFTDTLWAMVAHFDPPLPKFMEYYPQGLDGLVKIKSTFRTPTGRKYGPQFIDLGLAIGEKLYDVITTEFSPDL